jgi:hypothetical protein
MLNRKLETQCQYQPIAHRRSSSQLELRMGNQNRMYRYVEPTMSRAARLLMDVEASKIPMDVEASKIPPHFGRAAVGAGEEDEDVEKAGRNTAVELAVVDAPPSTGASRPAAVARFYHHRTVDLNGVHAPLVAHHGAKEARDGLLGCKAPTH